MTKDYNFNIKSPSECTSTELAEFVRLVESEGEVIDRLKGRVEDRGYKLIFVRNQQSLSAVGALKTPYPKYRSDVFAKAKTSSLPEDYSHELGWIVVSPNARQNRLATRLTNKLLRSIEDKSVFATVRTDNEHMQRCLNSLGFNSTGNSYPSSNRDANLVLFIRK